MITVAKEFSGVLDAWCARHGLLAPSKPSSARAVMTPEVWAALVDEAVAQCPGPAPGFEIGACFRLDHAGAFGYLVVNTCDLGELLETYHLLETRFYGQGWSIWRRTSEGGSLAWPRPADAPHPRVLEQLHATALLAANHRVHHARNPKYIDKNLGGVFMIWDHLFGTYVAEDPSDPPEYGTVRQVYSYSILTLTFHEYFDMFRDAARPGPLSLRLKHFWGPPEWERPAATVTSMPQGDRT